MCAIEYKKVSLAFDDKDILKDFSLSIQAGEKILITGKSGKGKSTLLRLLLGFESVDSGEIFVDGQAISEAEFYQVRKRFAYVNQDVTLRPGIVSHVLKEIAKFSGNHFSGVLPYELMEHFEFDPALLDKDTEALSGGERQRLGIMIAIMLKRPIYLLDEVTSALDEELKDKVVSYFIGVEETVVAISHDSVWLDNNVVREVVW